MGKVKVESVRLRVSNASDDERVYDISCTLNTAQGQQSSVDNGQVIKSGNLVADFSQYGEESFSLTFHNTPADEQCTVMTAINTFISDAIAMSETNAEEALN